MMKRLSLVIVLGLFSFAAHAKVDKCAEWLKAMTPSERIDRPLAKIEKHLLNFSNLNKKEPAATLKKVRKFTYQASIMAEVYYEVYGEPFGAILKRINRFKSALGKYVDAHNHLQISLEINTEQPNQLPPDFIAYLKSQKIIKYKKLQELMQQEGWQVGRQNVVAATKEIRSDISNVKLFSPDKERKKIVQYMESHLSWLDEAHYAVSDISDGVHDLRKDIRYVVLFHDAFEDLIQVPGGKKKKLEKYVVGLGEIKDVGEYIDLLYEYYRYEGDNKPAARKKAKVLGHSLFDTKQMRRKGHKIHNKFDNSDVISKIAKKAK